MTREVGAVMLNSIGEPLLINSCNIGLTGYTEALGEGGGTART